MNIYQLIVICSILIVVVLVLFLPLSRTRRRPDIPDERPPDLIFRDDERYWLGGILYKNPDDPALFVPKRFGFGWTLNFGHPKARLFLLVLLMVLLLLVLGPPLLLTFFGNGSMPSGCHTLGCQP